ncbi:MAG TPA: carbohydrate ABC transporter permease [Spirochaetia bacterium]|nr:carbohydrate ABC transporter permease [Spirochaetia bacterium]
MSELTETTAQRGPRSVSAGKRLSVLEATGIVLFSLISIAMIFPFLVMLLTSLKQMKEILSPQFVVVPHKLMWSNYLDAMLRGNWALYFFNTTFVTFITVLVSLVLNSMAGYAFARLQFKGRNALFIISLIGLMIPPQVTMVPVFLILKHIPLAGGNDILGNGGLGWINSYMGLIAPYVAGSFGVFLFRQFYLNFPKSLDDASRIDGIGRFRTYYHIYIPSSMPVIATLICLKSTDTWNQYTWPLIITVNDNIKTVQLALTNFRDQFQTQWNYLMAATTLIVLPLIIIFLFVQKYFVRGIVTSGMKG